MQVKDVMTREPACCSPETNLATATELMWSKDCGVLPVVSHDGHLTGILTDRDICIALGTKDRPAREVSADMIATKDVKTCFPEDDIHTAMAMMRRSKVRRLPVVSREGEIQGLIALNDIVLAVDRTHGPVTYEEVMNTVKAVSEHRVHHGVEPERRQIVAVA